MLGRIDEKVVAPRKLMVRRPAFRERLRLGKREWTTNSGSVPFCSRIERYLAAPERVSIEALARLERGR